MLFLSNRPLVLSYGRIPTQEQFLKYQKGPRFESHQKQSFFKYSRGPRFEYRQKQAFFKCSKGPRIETDQNQIFFKNRILIDMKLELEFHF